MASLILAGLLTTAALATEPTSVAAGLQSRPPESPSISIAGRVRFGPSPRPSQPNRMVVQAALALTDALGSSEEAVVADDGTFELKDVAGPRIVRVGGQGPEDGQWWFESVLWNGRDVTNEPVDFSREPHGELVVVMSARPTAIVGSVEDIAGIPMTGACVVMLPDDADLMRGWSTAVAATTADRRGRFYFTGMPPGDYRIEGLGRECPDVMEIIDNADVLKRRATAVSVGAGKIARIVVTGETFDARP